jgi:tetratricopeptide (TPR) repeat protein
VTSILLSAAMIVRDEERFLDACLASLHGVADEVVIADTGSRDRSREIADRHGARVIDFPWRQDFAAARNAALAAARGSWILYIDADERVRAIDRTRLAEQLADPRLLACTVLFRPARGYTRYREHRLFRNDPRLRFRGVIHESHLPALDELLRQGAGIVGESDLAIDHEGYEGDLTAKHRRNRPLLEARLRAEPDHVYAWSHLGSTLHGMGELEAARAAYQRGLAVVRAGRARAATDSLAYLGLVQLHMELGEPLDGLLDEALASYPDQWTLIWLQVRHLIASGRPAEALPLLARLTAIDPATLCTGQLAHDERIFGVHAWDAAGLCNFRLGRYAESAACYARGESCGGGRELELRTKRRLAEARARAAAQLSLTGCQPAAATSPGAATARPGPSGPRGA